MLFQRLHIPRSFSVLFWVFLLVIGAVTGAIAFITSYSVSFCLHRISNRISFPIVHDSTLQISNLMLYILLNLTFVTLSALLVLYVSPLAAGSGIPNMYAYLNGVDMPKFLNIRVALAKVPGSILAVAGGLAIGKEGPLLHVGSIIATWLGNSNVFTVLRGAREEDPLTNGHYARELVACGVATGLAAGFSAPVGGLLFALEMSTRWRSELTARTLFACAVVSFATQAMKKIEGESTLFKYGSLLFFKDVVKFPIPYAQIPLMAVLGIIGGFVGCMFTSINISLGMKRRAILDKPLWRYVELMAITLLTTGLRLVLPLLGDCRECICTDGSSNDAHDCFCAPGSPDLQQFHLYRCHEGSYNDVAVLMFNPQGYIVKALFASPASAFSGESLLFLFLFYYGLSILTYGTAIPAGLFTPSLITGGALGQLFAFVINRCLEAGGFHIRAHGGLYALLGAGSVLGGLFRFNVSISVILAELTGAEEQLPFLMLVLIISKGVGDRFNQSILNHLCILLGLPYIGGHPKSAIRRQRLTAGDIMDAEFPTLSVEEELPKLELCLNNSRYAAFPVTKKNRCGTTEYIGMITSKNIRRAISAEMSTNDIGSTSNGKPIDLRVFICRPLVIPMDMSLTGVHGIFTRSGLEYIPVMNSYGPVCGVITRHQLLELQSRVAADDGLRAHISVPDVESKSSDHMTEVFINDQDSNLL